MSKPLTLNAVYGASPTTASTAAKPARIGFWARLHQSITLSRQRTAEREIGRFIELHGGQLTDDIEREISRRFGGPAGGR